MIVGGLIHDAATALRARLEREPPPLRVERTYVQPDTVHWDDETYRGTPTRSTAGPARSPTWT